LSIAINILKASVAITRTTALALAFMPREHAG